MATQLSNYQSFDATKFLFEFQRPFWEAPDSLLDLCKKIVSFALSILLLPLALPADLILTSLSFIVKKCCLQNISDNLDWKIRRLENPMPLILDDLGQFRAAIQEAFSYLSIDKKEAFQELFINQGVPEEGDPIVDIFKWSAEAIIVHSLRTPNAQSFPFNDPMHQQPMAQIKNLYETLCFAERAAVCLKCIDADVAQPFSAAQFDLFHAIQRCAIEITQNRFFYRQVFGPLMNEVNNL